MSNERTRQIDALQQQWKNDPRWTRDPSARTRPPTWSACAAACSPSTPWPAAAPRSCGSWSTARRRRGYVNAFGAISGGQAMQQAKAGLEAVYLSGWQVAADGNTSETMYPDQSLYAYDSVPTMVRRINNTFQRADEIQWKNICDGKMKEEDAIDFFLPIVATAKPASAACSTPTN